MLLYLIADYGNNDPAFVEVSQRLHQYLPSLQIHCLSVPAFSTLATGFWIAQLGLNSGPDHRIIYHNCAPRQDDPEARVNNEGEGLTYALLPNGVKVVGVWAGYTLSFIKESALELYSVNVSRGGSQFRSRDVFPQAAARIFQGDKSLLSNPLLREQVPDAPDDRIAWIDGYGNLKTSIPADTISMEPETKVIVRVGDMVSDAVYSDGSFRVPEGTLAFAPGSSGWPCPGEKGCIRLMELFLRGGSAWRRFGMPRVNETITYQIIN